MIREALVDDRDVSLSVSPVSAAVVGTVFGASTAARRRSDGDRDRDGRGESHREAPRANPSTGRPTTARRSSPARRAQWGVTPGPGRAQTEPIAALVAVMVLIAGVGLYAAYVGGALEGSDRTTEATTAEHVWDDLEDGERGVFPAYEYESGTDAAIRDAIDPDSLPDGRNVYVEIRAYDGGRPTVFAAAHFDSDGDDLADRQLASSHEDFGPPREAGEPAETGIETRPISIEVTPADVRGGTLHVEVW